MKQFLLNTTLCFLLLFPVLAKAQGWNELLTDASSDGAYNGLLDGTKLEYRYNTETDTIWFRVTTSNMDNLNSEQVGVNVMVNIPGGGTNFNFWGSQNKAAYHRLLTAWVVGSAPSNYGGTIGIADAGGVMGQRYNNVHKNNLSIRVDIAKKQIAVGVLREHLIPNQYFEDGKPLSVGIAAAVGSNTSWNDDIYQSGTKMEIERKSSVGISEKPQLVKLHAYPNPTKNALSVSGLNSKTTTYSVYNVSGQLLLTGTYSSSIDVSGLKPGLYLLRLNDGEWSDCLSFIKR